MRPAALAFLLCLSVFANQKKTGWFAENAPSLEVKQKAELELCQQKLEKRDEQDRKFLSMHDALAEEHKALLSDYEQLKKEKTFGEYTAAIVIFIMALGAGLGIGLLNKIAVGIKRLLPSAAKKQLVVFIVGSLWLTVVAVGLASDNSLSKHPVNLIIMIFIYSLPALLFGGIALWWINKPKQELQ